jgi:hypothetical protein
MCCFSRPVESVTQTRIFARNAGDSRQFLVYSMHLSAGEDLAMILPLPVPKGTGERGLKFINFEKYPNFFVAMEDGFPRPPQPKAVARGRLGTPPTDAPLEVISVGSFEASFVPSIADFDRLDERFRLPGQVWERLPQFSGHGFAVFKLKKGKQTVHPMAFEFPRANPRNLFFPTVHIHDGAFHDKADFDHVLYAQFHRAHRVDSRAWLESLRPASMFLDLTKCQGLLEADDHVYKRVIRGRLKNEDVLA